MKKRIMTIVCCTLLVMLLIPQMVFASSDNRLSLKELQELPENSMERYAYSKALENNTSYEYELNKEREAVVLRAYDEYVTYRTKVQTAGSIKTVIGTLYPQIATEAKVIVSKLTGKVREVLDFGAPYGTVWNENSTWQGGGFNINRTSSVSARISSTGQFFIDNGDLSIGFEIIGYSINLGYRTSVKTIVAHMEW